MKYELINFCEFDKYAEKSYCAIHNVSADLNLGDITKVNEKEINDFDMMTWGFPCTDISAAGKQKGFTDDDGNKTRSGLYYDGLRILKEKKPKFSIIENVKALAQKKFKAEFDMILDDLNECGYNTYYQILNAKDYGVPQNRERVFLVSIRKDIDNGLFKFPVRFDNGIRLKDMLEENVNESFYISQIKVEQLLKNLENKIDINAQVIGTCHKKNELSFSTRDRGYNENCLSPTLSATMYKDAPKVMQIGNIVNTGNFENPQRGRIYSADGCSPALNCCGGGGLEPKILEVGYYPYPNSNKKHQSNTVYDVKGISPTTDTGGFNNRQFKILETNKVMCLNTKDENGKQPPQQARVYNIEGIMTSSMAEQDGRFNILEEKIICEQRSDEGLRFFKDNICGTIRTINSGGDKRVIENNFRIRKLTPKESFRLMGFTDEDFNKAKYESAQSSKEILEKYPNHKGKRIMEYGERIERMSNSQVYKQAGNSIVTKVLVEIYKCLQTAFPNDFTDGLKVSSFFSGIGAFEKAMEII